ncbi:MAG: hypothetical protein ACXWUG_09565 [Polyangiales bacterium]
MDLLRSITKKFAVGAVGVALFASAPEASAQVTPPPDRDRTWGGVTDATAAIALGTAVLMPRIFYPEPEVTVGWHARWHVSVLAPVMTLATLSLLNENWLKQQVKSNRPGCDDTNVGVAGCTDYGGPSSHAFAAGSAFGHGLAVFIFDTTKWSNGRANAVSAVGNIAVPLVLGGITIIGRSKGNYENGGQIVAGGTLGLGIGFLTGMTYALMQRPECGFSGSLICW